MNGAPTSSAARTEHVMASDRALVPVEAKPEPFGRGEIELIKRTVARGTTDDELKLFLYTAQRTGLDPLAKQIHAIKRWNGREKREVMSIQTGIDGYRLIAERTGAYAPGQEPKLVMGEKWPDSATAYVKKLVAGTWHEVAATAYFEEFAQKDKEGHLTPMWARMPKLMLAKCAEALALRRAFPAEMSGVYTFEEMAQADSDHQPEAVEVKTPATADNIEALKNGLEKAIEARGQDPHALPAELPAPEPMGSIPSCPNPGCESTKVMRSKYPKKGAFYCLECKASFD